MVNIEELIEDVRKSRLQITRNRVAMSLRAMRANKQILKHQEQDNLKLVQEKLTRVLDKFKELGYNIEICDPTDPRLKGFSFSGTNGVTKFEGTCKLGIVNEPNRVVDWYYGSTEEPAVLLIANMVRKGDIYCHPRICRISYRCVMRTTNEILQVLLRNSYG